MVLSKRKNIFSKTIFWYIDFFNEKVHHDNGEMSQVEEEFQENLIDFFSS